MAARKRRARGGKGRAGPGRAVTAVASVPVLRLAGFYGSYFGILGSFLPYWPLYLQAAGYDAAAIGWIMAMGPATKVVSPSLWGWLADRSGRTLGLIRWAAFLSLVAFLSVFGVHSALGMVAATLAFTFFWNGVMPLFETLTLEHLHHDTRPYGRIRLWGSVGFIATVYTMGEALNGPLPIATLPQVVAALFALQWLLSLTVPAAAVPHEAHAGTSLRGILRQGGVIGLFLASFLHQAAHGPYYAFFSVYLQEHGYSRAATGQLWALGVGAEILMFLVAARLIHRVGLRGVFLGSLALSAMRWLFIAWGVDRLSLILLAQVLHAASFGSAHAAAILLIHQYFRGPHHAKGQALYGSLSFGLGGAIGSFLGGQFWTRPGPEWVFTGAAGVSLLALLAAWPRVGLSGVRNQASGSREPA